MEKINNSVSKKITWVFTIIQDKKTAAGNNTSGPGFIRCSNTGAFIVKKNMN
jgi:hypothetical protein